MCAGSKADRLRTPEESFCEGSQPASHSPVDEIAELLRQRDCAFAFVTGYGREALPAGFRHVPLLGKPYSPDQLLTTVELLLGSGAELMDQQQKSHKIEAQSASKAPPLA